MAEIPQISIRDMDDPNVSVHLAAQKEELEIFVDALANDDPAYITC